jgi:hypothetical protein
MEKVSIGTESTPVYSDDPEAVCGGELPIAKCPLIKSLLSNIVNTRGGVEGDTGSIWVISNQNRKYCSDCGNYCQMEVDTVGRKVTGRARFRFINDEAKLQ